MEAEALALKQRSKTRNVHIEQAGKDFELMQEQDDIYVRRIHLIPRKILLAFEEKWVYQKADRYRIIFERKTDIYL
jgi:hypothetical protein